MLDARAGSRRTATRVVCGASFLSSSSHFPLMLYSNAAIVDLLADMGAASGLDEDDMQAIMAEAMEAPHDGQNLNVHAAVPSSTSSDLQHSIRLRPLNLREFLELSLKPREMLLDPILPEKGLAMLYAARGTGKTHVAIGIAFAVATGSIS